MTMLASSAVTQVPRNGFSTWDGGERVQASGIAALISTTVPRKIRRTSSGLDTIKTFSTRSTNICGKAPGATAEQSAKMDHDMLRSVEAMLTWAPWGRILRRRARRTGEAVPTFYKAGN